MADQGAQGLLSPFLRRQRMAAARPWLQGSVFDFGCGSGALAAGLPPGAYCGHDADPAVLGLAQARHPQHRFVAEVPASGDWDTVACLAVIEHCAEPAAFLSRLAALAREGGRIVLTTPHPAYEIFHDAGARIGLFSHDASEEHEVLLDRGALQALADAAGLAMTHYRRFLFGANQLCVLQRT
ncbi:class I SAM-dependent methyltransferase [Dokdonella sp.]|uniref:class I SAM-dependent methyltransferase n=1 Tax=Dokdonella sp. TaxID=2291710 RepID=UPI0031C7EF14|nr:methyltransferase domain-containing protein [Dokdonella sp.]